VLGPSIDGGYYLVGLKQPCPGLFKDVQWSSASVLERTVRNARALRKKISFLKKWYDIDDPAGLARLKRDLHKNAKAAPWTRLFLKI
ncbi:MAG: DUF2064 domain-containing protein, partial [bacterium]|nr:DUF2064 domain-containing protein [bacterium]